MSNKEEKVFEYIKRLGDKSGKINLSLSKAQMALKIGREELENTLVSLSKKGKILLISVPPSPIFISYVINELIEMDKRYISGQLSLDKYLNERNRIISIINSSDIRETMPPPLPKAKVTDVLEGLTNISKYMLKLVKLKNSGEVNDRIFEKLFKQYTVKFSNTLDLSKRYIATIRSCIVDIESTIHDYIENIDAIRIDEKIRNIDRSSEIRSYKNLIMEEKKLLDNIANSLDLVQKTSYNMQELEKKLRDIETLLSSLRDEYEYVSVKAEIEESNEELMRRSIELKDRIQKLEKEKKLIEDTIRRYSKAESTTKAIEMIMEAYNNIKEIEAQGIIKENLTKEVDSLLNMLKTIYNKVIDLNKRIEDAVKY